MTCSRCGLTMLLIFLGYFLLPSLTEGVETSTCSPGRLTVTCDAGKVIFIKQVRRGSYTGAFNVFHCNYRVGDHTEHDDGNSKEVWKKCNLQSKCAVLFIQSGNVYLEMDYECAYKTQSPASSDAGTGSPGSNRDVNIPVTFGVAVPLIIVSAILLWKNETISRLCKGHSNETTDDIITQTNATDHDHENASQSNFDNPAFDGDQNPRLTQSSDTNNSIHLNVSENPTHRHNQMMPTYENIEHGARMPGVGTADASGAEMESAYARLDPVERTEYLDMMPTYENTEHGRNPGSRDLDTDAHRQKAPAPRGEEMGDTGARMPGVGTVAASGEETESPYAGLDPVEYSEYLDLRGFAHQSPSKNGNQ